MSSARRRREPVVAIDGPAGAGKSTAARLLAQRLGFVLVDTGALYRGVALCAQERGIDWQSGPLLERMIQQLSFGFEEGPDGAAQLTIDGRDRSADIRSPAISTGASQVSRHPEVRRALLGLQRQLGAVGGVVLEGRDIGTVVFPDADVKVFLTASDEARARRRHEELEARGHEVVFDEVLTGIRERDQLDSERDVAPLRAADDATVIDTSGLSLDEVIERLLELVRRAMASP